MDFQALAFEGAFGILECSKVDSRGKMIRIWNQSPELSDFDLKEVSVASNPTEGTLRGLHFQEEPFSEKKIVFCTQGRVYDVVVDLRTTSSTYLQHLAFEMGEDSPFIGMIIPPGCAHGYLTLVPNSSLVYFIDNVHSQEHSQGIKWDDEKLSIEWPFIPTVISERDQTWPAL